jgi:hypothetical protein
VFRVGDDDDLERRVMGQQPGWHTNRAEQRFQVAGRQIDEESTGLFLGKLIEFVRQIFEIPLLANFSAFQTQDCLARERQKVSLE